MVLSYITLKHVHFIINNDRHDVVKNELWVYKYNITWNSY